jgi:membrane protein YdbS with pleckstrin-like domain
MEDLAPLDAATLAGEAFALHPRLHLLRVARSVITAGVLSLGAAGALVASGRWWLLPVVPLGALLLLGLSYAYGTAWMRRFRCLLLPDGLLLRRGVWWRVEVFVPRARIQHTELHEAPLMRALGMASLRVFTAGTRLAELAVDGLPRESALRLRDRLLDRHGHDAV